MVDTGGEYETGNGARPSENESGSATFEREIAARKQAEAHLLEALERESLMSRLSGQIAEVGLDAREIAAVTARVVGAQLGDFCVVSTISEDRVVARSLGIYHTDPDIAERLWRATGSELPIVRQLAATFETGEPYIYTRTRDDAGTSEIWPELQEIVDDVGGIRALIIAPLWAGGKSIGAISVARSTRPLAFTNDDVDLAVEAAERVAPVLADALEYQRIRRELQDRRETELALQRGNRELARRVAASSEDLMRANRELESLFEDSPIPMILIDCSGVLEYLDSLDAAGEDLGSFLDRRRETLLVALGRIRVLNVNEALTDLFGLSGPEAARGSITRLYSAARHEFFRAQLLAVAQRRERFVDRVELSSGLGDRRHLEIHLRVLPGHVADYGRVLVSLIDKTAEIEAREELERVNGELAERVEARTAELSRRDLELSLLADIVQASDAAITAGSADGVVTVWNPGAERLYGFSAAEAIGTHELDLIPPEGRDTAAAALARVLDGEVVRFDHERIRKDGSRVRVSASLSPVRSDTGEVIGYGCIAHDLGEAAPAYRDARDARLELLADFSQDLSDAGDDVQELLRTVARRCSEAVGDAAVIYMTSDDGSWLLPVAYHHPDPVAMDLLGRGLEHAQRVDESIARGSVRERRTISRRASELGPDERFVDAATEFEGKVGVAGILSVPLAIGDRGYGAVTVSRDAGNRDYSNGDARLLEELAARTAAAISRAGFFDKSPG